MTQIRDLFGMVHTIQECAEEQVPEHFELIKDYVEKESLEAFEFRMLECVKHHKGHAYHIDNEVFLYYQNDKPWHGQAAALYGEKSPAKLMALFIGVFTEIDTSTFKMDFHLHEQTFREQYKSILTLTSLTRQNDEDYPLVIRIDKLKAKFQKLYDTRGIERRVSDS